MSHKKQKPTNTPKDNLLSTGPRTRVGKKVASQNSRTHGLLSEVPVFKSPEEESQYADLHSGIYESIGPLNRLEELLVEEITNCFWKKRIPVPWAQSQVSKRLSRSIERTINHVVQNSGDPLLPLPGVKYGAFPWICKELVLSFSNNTQEQGKDTLDLESNRKTEKYSMEIKIADPMATIERYEAKINRNLDRALNYLARLRDLRSRKDDGGDS
jgi:hypothetical protein